MHIALNGLFLSEKNTGGGRYLLDLLQGLQSVRTTEKYSVFVSRKTGTQKWVTQPGFEVVACGWMTDYRPSRIVWEHHCLQNVVSRKGIDVFHAAGFTLPAQLKARSVITIFDMTFFLMPQVHEKSKVAYFRSMIPAAVKKADAVIAISSQTKCDIIKYLGTPEEKIRVVPIGIGDEFRVIADKERIESVKAAYSLPDEYILFVGTLEPRKNIGGLIRAYARLRKRGCRHTLVIAGKRGWQCGGIYKLVESLLLSGDVVFTDYISQEDLPVLYNGAAAFVYPSLYEGFGIPVLEAMKCGVPVVTSGISSMPEVTGDAAVLIDPYDDVSLMNGIERVVRDRSLAASLRMQGLRRASSFTREKMARETVAVYNSVTESAL